MLRFSQCSELHVFRTIQFEPFVRKLSQFFVNLEKESEILSTDIEVKFFETWYERKYLIYCFIACNKNRNIKNFYLSWNLKYKKSWGPVWFFKDPDQSPSFENRGSGSCCLKIPAALNKYLLSTNVNYHNGINYLKKMSRLAVRQL